MGRGPDGAGRTVLRCIALVLLVGLSAGCAAQYPRYQRGALLTLCVASASEAPVSVSPSYKAADMPPVWGPWRFQPRFFLWPLNLVRTPLGLAGCAFSGVDEGLHWGAFIGSVPVGIGTALLYGVVRATLVHWALELVRGGDDLTAEDGMTYPVPCMRIWSAVLETFIFPLDAVHTALHGEPTWYYIAREGESNAQAQKDPWSDAIRRQWQFARDYKVYPPLPYWPARF